MTFDIQHAVGSSLETDLGRILLIRFLGRGKSGYSYLGVLNNKHYTVKLMHDEPCAYYAFGDTNKVEHEINSYKLLNHLGLVMPKLLTFNLEQNYLVKEYIKGTLATELIADGGTQQVMGQLYKMSKLAKKAGINLDYFPANFVLNDKTLYYIDYEHNPYSPEWNLENWGVYYWANTEGMIQYLKTGHISTLNQSKDSGVPIKEPFELIVANWNRMFSRTTS